MTCRQYPRKSSADLSTAPSIQASAASWRTFLREALPVIGQHGAPARIAVTAAMSSYVTVVEATPSGHTTGAAELDGDFSVLRDRAAMAGIRIVTSRRFRMAFGSPGMSRCSESSRLHPGRPHSLKWDAHTVLGSVTGGIA